MPAKKTGGRRSGYVWMKLPTEADVEKLRTLISANGSPWDQWEYKLERGRIVIYDPVIPFNPDTHRFDPARRYMSKHLRLSPVIPGPFQLEYYRHTGRFAAVPVVGTIEEVASAILTDLFGVCAPSGTITGTVPKS
jgi:hypothetical protein